MMDIHFRSLLNVMSKKRTQFHWQWNTYQTLQYIMEFERCLEHILFYLYHAWVLCMKCIPMDSSIGYVLLFAYSGPRKGKTCLYCPLLEVSFLFFLLICYWFSHSVLLFSSFSTGFYCQLYLWDSSLSSVLYSTAATFISSGVMFEWTRMGMTDSRIKAGFINPVSYWCLNKKSLLILSPLNSIKDVK